MNEWKRKSKSIQVLRIVNHLGHHELLCWNNNWKMILFDIVVFNNIIMFQNSRNQMFKILIYEKNIIALWEWKKIQKMRNFLFNQKKSHWPFGNRIMMMMTDPVDRPCHECVSIRIPFNLFLYFFLHRSIEFYLNWWSQY